MSIPLTLAENWKSFEFAIINPNAPQLQREEMRRAFHAGFLRAYQILTDSCAEMEEEQAVETMSTLENEILAYGLELLDAAGMTPEEANFKWADAPEGSKPQ